jgi:hypothetical protein
MDLVVPERVRVEQRDPADRADRHGARGCHLCERAAREQGLGREATEDRAAPGDAAEGRRDDCAQGTGILAHSAAVGFA